MKSYSLGALVEIALVIVLVIGPCTAAWAQEKKNDIFSITPAFSFAWYPSANFFKEVSTDTEVDLENFGMSAIMSLKLFNKVGARLNLKIDDPAFKKLVDVAGFVTASYFILKFDYHSFGGTVTWKGNTPNPISGDVYNFRNQWTNVSLLFRIDQLTVKNEWLRGFLAGLMLTGTGNLGAIGIGYARYDMPLEYQAKSGGLSNPGFGLVKGEAWGFSVLWDTLSWNMEGSTYSGSQILYFMQHIWICLDWFHGLSFISKGETDAQAIAWMSNANKGVSVDGNIKSTYTIVKANLGFQHMWNIGKKGRIGLAVGVEMLEETIDASNDDIKMYFWSTHVGPAVRVSARW